MKSILTLIGMIGTLCGVLIMGLTEAFAFGLSIWLIAIAIWIVGMSIAGTDSL